MLDLSLTKRTDLLTQKDYDDIYELYKTKKHLVKLNGQKATIHHLNSRFPVVSTKNCEMEAEFSIKAVERILSTHCEFKS